MYLPWEEKCTRQINHFLQTLFTVRKLLQAMVHAKFGGRAGSSEEKFAMIVYFLFRSE
jgi:hypothetical protein